MTENVYCGGLTGSIVDFKDVGKRDYAGNSIDLFSDNFWHYCKSRGGFTGFIVDLRNVGEPAPTENSIDSSVHNLPP
ncbi:MAG: hypothetical protein ACRC62_07445 [Microcoleus sp.]